VFRFTQFYMIADISKQDSLGLMLTYEN